MATKWIYDIYKEKWIVELLFDNLYTWNRWFWQARRTTEGMMVWGSNMNYPIQDWVCLSLDLK